MQPRRRPVLRATLLVFALSLGLRLVWVYLSDVKPIDDFKSYDEYAWSWLKSGQFGSEGAKAWRTPGYPAFLALIYAVFGHSVKAAGFAQALLGALSSALIVLLASNVISPRASGIAGLIHAVSPSFLVYVPVLASENATIPPLLAGLLFLAVAGKRIGLRRDVFLGGSGFLIGLSMLVRPAVLFVLPAVLLLALYDPLRRQMRPRGLLSLVVGTLLAIAPWQIRNRLVARTHPAKLATHGGCVLRSGNNDFNVNGGSCRNGYLLPRGFPENEKDAAYNRAARRWIIANPGRYLGLCRVRGLRLLGPDPDPYVAYFLASAASDDATLGEAEKSSARSKAAREQARQILVRRRECLRIFRIVIAPLILLSLGLAVFRWRHYAIAVLPALSYVSGICLTYFAPRYRYVSEPLLFIPLAGLICDILFGTTELGARIPRLAKAFAAVAVILATYLLDANGIIRDLSRISPKPAAERGDQTLTLLDYKPSRVVLGGAPDQYKSFWDYGSNVTVAREADGLRCQVDDRPEKKGSHYGGIAFPISGFDALRLDLTFLKPGNITLICVDACDADKRLFRWQWPPGKYRPLESGRHIYLFVPGGRATKGFRFRDDWRLARNALKLHVFICVAQDAEAGIILHRAETAIHPKMRLTD
ncbi:MAG: glycosyltransferase family 39 protein [Phycisphaerae bacterium]|nr:glycosyltransferase family 39 protein [Phycisphaerae bacterium]